MHDDDTFEEFLKREAKDYPPATTPPADAMWAAIEHDVADAITPRPARSISPRRVWHVIGTSIAAALIIGVGVGRWTAATAPVVALAPDDAQQQAAHTEASAASHLAETEVFLTSLRADMKAGRTDVDRAARSRELLARTRLLLAAPGQGSPAVNQLLEDLELLLAEISALPAHDGSMDKTLLDETMRNGNVLLRIRTLPRT